MAYKTGPMFSPTGFREYFLPHLQRVAAVIQGEGLPWIVHSDGNLMLLLDDLLTLGFDGLHPLEPGPMDIEAVKRDYGQRLCLVGNIDLHYTLTRGHPGGSGRGGQTADRNHRQRWRLYDQQRQFDYVILQS